MAVLTTRLGRPRRPSRRVGLAPILIAIYAAFLLGAAIGRQWPLDASGHPIPLDYLGMWAAGRMALLGHAAAAYDFVAHGAVEIGALGRDSDRYFSWFYPPTFFLATAPFATLPYVPALLAWVSVGLALFLAALHLVLPERGAVILAVAVPAVLWNATIGQNGCLSAALIAGALACLDRRPIVAGALIACLTFKPQFGLLIPVALLCGGHWRVFLSATLASVLLVAISAALFGREPWTAFLGSIDVAYRSILVDNLVGAAKLQSLFGVVRALGGAIGPAWAAQALVAVPVTGFVGWLWRSSAAADCKAAALAAGTVLATPYVLTYDLVILVVPLAFLARSGLSRSETVATAAAGLLLLSAVVTDLPVGLGASLIVAGIVVARVIRSFRGEMVAAPGRHRPEAAAAGPVSSTMAA